MNFYLNKDVVFRLLIFVPLALLLSCSGDEVIGVNKRPPEMTMLIEHLGDTGDQIFVDGVLLNDTNNGIDTVPDNDWIRIQWKPIFDPRVDYLKIYRFGDYSQTTLVDSLSRSQWMRNEYLDNRLHSQNPVGQVWSYYVETYNQFGYYTVSDTVSYKLTEKPFITSPPDMAQISSGEPIVFEWMETQDALHYRILVFDSDHQYIWHHDYYLVEDSEYQFEYNGPDLSAYDMIVWRIDSFGDLDNELGVSISGAESRERSIYLSD